MYGKFFIGVYCSAHWFDGILDLTQCIPEINQINDELELESILTGEKPIIYSYTMALWCLLAQKWLQLQRR